MDYDELFNRIKEHKLPYDEIHDEIFEWYTHARLPMGQQVLIYGSKFNAVCPPMSLNIMRMSSSIHPKYRLDYRF